MPPFAELGVATNFSFLRGASHPEELVAQAHGLGLAGIGIADRNTMAGIVRAWSFARLRFAGDAFRVVSGTRLVFADGTPDVLAYPADRAAYGRLTRLLTLGNSRAPKGACVLFAADLLAAAPGLQLIVTDRSTAEEPGPGRVPPALADGLAAAGRAGKVVDFPGPAPASRPGAGAPAGEAGGAASVHRFEPAAGRHSPKLPRNDGALLRDLRAAGARVWVAAVPTYGPDPQRRLATRVALARAHGLPLIATNDVTMHAPDRRPLSDVLACIRHGVSLDEAGFRLAANAERHLKAPVEMARLFEGIEDAVAETGHFLDGIGFSLDQLRNEYPDESRDGFASEQDALEAYAAAGAAQRYPAGVPEGVRDGLARELAIVAQMAYAAYFLTVHAIVRFAKDQGILCQGRGSAANSLLCYCLGITDVSPELTNLLFERFISPSRNEPPDIDVDFEHERREVVMQHIYGRYGRLHAGLTATVVTYRTRSTLREVGRAFGLSDDTVAALTGTVWGYWSGGVDTDQARRVGLDPDEPRMAAVLRLAGELAGFPRHLSQHTGGFVITRARLDETVPVANAAMKERTTVEWDKDDLDAVGLLKVDVLALGMLTCLKRGFDLLEAHYGRRLALDSIPKEEPAVYAMIARADTLGVFQIESRAQMSMLPRLRPDCFYDLVIEVAIVRPGPIQGDMVHPYLKRRLNREAVEYPSPELKEILKKTLGVPLFQEQAMRIAMVAAEFTSAEADELRRAMATFKRAGAIGGLRDRMVETMVRKGYPREFAERCFKQIEGFGTYGFPESHAASFALLVYASAWLKCRYPDVFACAMLNSQPMGFYAPAQLVRDARDHGVEVRPADVNASRWDHALEDGTGAGALHPDHVTMAGAILGDRALRLGLRQVKGLREADAALLVDARGPGYDSVRDLWLRARLGSQALERLAAADAFRSLGLDRRDALWAVRGLNRSGDKDDLPLFARTSGEVEAEASLPRMPPGEHVVEDYRALSLSLKAHPVSFLRATLDGRRALRAADLGARAPGGQVTVAGLVLIRQRPGTAAGIIFVTIEDETGVANVIVKPTVFERQRAAVVAARFVAVTGRLQNHAGVVHVVAERVADLSPLLATLSRRGPEVSSLARADEVARPVVSRTGADRGARETVGSAGFPLARDNRGSAPGHAAAARAMPKGRNFH